MRCTEPKSDRLSFVLHMSYIVLWDASEFIHILFRGQFSPTSLLAGRLALTISRKKKTII